MDRRNTRRMGKGRSPRMKVGVKGSKGVCNRRTDRGSKSERSEDRVRGFLRYSERSWHYLRISKVVTYIFYHVHGRPSWMFAARVNI